MMDWNHQPPKAILKRQRKLSKWIAEAREALEFFEKQLKELRATCPHIHLPCPNCGAKDDV
jgi:hypothetical protein